jgi:DNA-binding transcriptional LysR family regulator
MDTLSNLKAFIAVADMGSFSEVARRASLVPSVVSKRIDQLEWRIKAPLFVRSTRKLTLTDVGERYLPTVRSLVQQLEDTLAGMAQASGDLEGHIRVKIPTTLGTLYLSELLHQFLREQPRISMDIVLADRSVNPLEEGFDLAIGALPELYGQVRDHPLCPIRRRLCAAPGYLSRRGTPQQAAELIEHDCLVFTTSGSRWEFQSPQGLVGVDVQAKLQTNDGVALCRATVSGMGIAVLADYLASPAIEAGDLVEILPDLRLPDIWLKALVPARRIDLPRVDMLLQWLTLHLQLPGPWARPTDLTATPASADKRSDRV